MNASDVTRRLRDRTLYASFLAQRTRLDGGCATSMNLTNNHGATFESSLLPLIKEGNLETTTEQRDAIVAAAACAGGSPFYTTGQFRGTTLSFYSAQVNSVLAVSAEDTWSSYLVKYDGSGTAVWGTRICATIIENSLDSAGTDKPHVFSSPDGSVYSFGNVWFNGTSNNFVDFYNASATTPALSVPVNNSAYGQWLAKYNAEGIVQWAVILRTTEDPVSCDDPYFVTDSNNNVYIQATYYNGTVDLYNTGNTADVVTTIDANGNYFTTFIIKYSSDGQFQWYSKLTNNRECSGSSLHCDRAGNLYASVIRRDTDIFYVYPWSDLSTPSITLNGGNSNEFNYSILKFNTVSGGIIWGTNIIGADTDYQLTMSSDSTNNMYAALHHVGSNYLYIYSQSDLNNPAISLPSRTNTWDMSLIKFTESGTALWASSIVSGNDNEWKASVVVDSSDNIMISGQTTAQSVDIYDPSSSDVAAATVTFDLSDFVLFIAKFNPSGVMQWMSYMGPDTNGDPMTKMGFSNDNSVVLSGVMTSGNNMSYYNSTGSSVFSLANDTNDNIMFFVKYTTDGTPVWRTYCTGNALPEFSI